MGEADGTGVKVSKWQMGKEWKMKIRHIVLGIRDFLRDWRHDRLVYKLFKMYRRAMYYEVDDSLFPIVEVREGSVWFYIKQRQIGEARRKNRGKKCTRS